MKIVNSNAIEFKPCENCGELSILFKYNQKFVCRDCKFNLLGDIKE